ncbi:MAG: hypothetical protein U5L09_10375 [Bacteroidales bacterium]|nr:hypothetical protein [Bacteroidales bacterium]
MNEKYNMCDISKPKSIKITNLDLNRDVDVVIANWYDDIKSIVYDKGDFRGIQIYDKHQNKKGKDDYPFLSIKRINDRSAFTGGRLKKMIRFLKNVKYHSDYEIELTSFDINAICYDINTSKYIDSPFYDLVKVIYNQLDSISLNKEHSDNLKSVDEHEYIFRNNSDKLENLKLIMSEVKSIFNDLNLVPIYG